ncbi:MAG: beta strand repeat-containing protein, partial [Archangium sp.]
FVDAAARNFRLTHRSPSRKSCSSGVDQGALPYTTNQTATVQGTLWENLTLSGAQTVTGDLTVAPGVTLTINPNATLTFAANDLQGGNNSALRGELVVLGTLTSIGVSGSPITFTSAGTGTSAWGGFVVRPGASASLAHAAISKAGTAFYVMQGATGTTTSLTVNNSSVTGGQYGLSSIAGTGTATWNIASTDFGVTDGLTHAGGALTMQASTITGAVNDYAIRQTGGTMALERTLLANNSDGVSITGGTSASFDRCTITKNDGYGIFTNVGSTAHTTTLVSSIVSHNGSYGLYRNSSGTFSVTYSNLWGNSGTWNGGTSPNSVGVNAIGFTSLNLGNVSPQFNKSENPLYANFAGNTFSLQSTSPSRGAGANGVDQGAYPYTVGAVTTVTVSPSTTSVNAGAVVGFAAQARDAMGNIVGNATFTWSVAPAAGTITSTGVLTASCTPGTYTAAVTATSANGISGNATVTINIGPASQITVSPATPSVKSQATEQFSAQVRDACNNVVTGQTITWSSNASAGTVTSGGLFTASCQRGSYTPGITATAGALSGSVPVTVIAGDPAAIAVTPTAATVTAGMTQQFAASVADGCGNTVSSPVIWSTNATGSSVSTSGLFTAGQTNGAFTVTATLGTRTGTADVTVTGGSGMTGMVSTVTVTPTPVTLAIGAMQTFTAVARDAQGTVVSGRPVTWSAFSQAGTITQGGVFTAGNTAGNFPDAITATVDGIVGRASIVLQAGGVASLDINPTMVTVAPGGVVTFTATARDNGGNVVTAPITWQAAIPVGTITQGGVLTATTNPGSYPASVAATCNGVTTTASVTVMNGALSQLLITPPASSVQAGGTVAFLASGRDSNGNTVSVTPTWSVTNGGGTISQSGVFTAGTTSGAFANTVKAEANGLSAFSSVTVTPGPVLSVSVSPMNGTVQAGGSLQFTAEARDAFNNVVPTGFMWTANQAAGSINQGGFFTAGSDPGSFPNGITAEASGVQGFANVTITPSGAGGGSGTGGGSATGGGSGAMGGGDGMTGGGSGSMGGGSGSMGGGDGMMGGGAGGGGDGAGNSGCGCTTVDPSFLALGLLMLVRRRRS